MANFICDVLQTHAANGAALGVALTKNKMWGMEEQYYRIGSRDSGGTMRWFWPRINDNIALRGKWISNSGGNNGILVADSGYVGIGIIPTSDLHMGKTTDGALGFLIKNGSNGGGAYAWSSIRNNLDNFVASLIHGGSEVGNNAFGPIANQAAVYAYGSSSLFIGTTNDVPVFVGVQEIAHIKISGGASIGNVEIARSLRVGSIGAADPGDNNVIVEGSIIVPGAFRVGYSTGSMAYNSTVNLDVVLGFSSPGSSSGILILTDTDGPSGNPNIHTIFGLGGGSTAVMAGVLGSATDQDNFLCLYYDFGAQKYIIKNRLGAGVTRTFKATFIGSGT